MKKIVLIGGLAMSFLVLAGCAKNTQEQSTADVSAKAAVAHDYKGEVRSKK